ncbi:MAG: hypothetical protein JSR26_03830 [Proteobacteria bacterium]|nr:hypothetical protein [Pseudomonadota bacterium]
MPAPAQRTVVNVIPSNLQATPVRVVSRTPPTTRIVNVTGVTVPSAGGGGGGRPTSGQVWPR